MTIPNAPLPQLSILLKALKVSPSEGKSWKGSDREGAVNFYVQGRWALAKGVQFLLSKMNKKEGVVLFPDYFCNEPLWPLRKMNLKLHFYPIKKNLNPNWDALEHELRKFGTPDIFVLVHYFGFTNDLDGAWNFCRQHKIYLLEDAAHALLPSGGNRQGDLAIYSPRKLLAIPEGGLLVIPREIYCNINEHRYDFNKGIIAKWLIKSIAQRLMICLGIPWHHFYKVFGNKKDLYDLNNDNNDMDCWNNIGCNTYTLKILSIFENMKAQVTEKRRENYEILSNLINDIPQVRLLFTSLPESVCPYAFPMILSSRGDNVIKKLQGYGIPADSWPDLPPEILRSEKDHGDALWLQRHIMLLPVHQDLSRKQIEYMSTILHKSIKRGTRLNASDGS